MDVRSEQVLLSIVHKKRNTLPSVTCFPREVDPNKKHKSKHIIVCIPFTAGATLPQLYPEKPPGHTH